MKNVIIALMGLSALTSCGTGSSSSPASPQAQDVYNLQGYKLSATQTNNCTLVEPSTLNCDSKGTFGGIYSITFSTPNGKPGAYVIMPPDGDQYGLNVAATGAGCPQSASTGGQSYTCNFTIGTNGTAKAGNTLYLKLNGSLGKVNTAIINIQ